MKTTKRKQSRFEKAFAETIARNVKEYEAEKLTADMGNNGWKIGDTCVMFTNKVKGYTAEFTVENFDGVYYGIRRGNYYHRVSPNRIFHSREEALGSLDPNETV